MPLYGDGEIAGGEVQQLARTGACCCRVAHPQRFDQLPVDFHGIATCVRRLVRGLQREFEAGLDDARQLLEHLIVARLQERFVEGDVRRRELHDVAFGVSHLLPGALNGGDFLHRRTRSSQFRSNRFDRTTRFQNTVQKIELKIRSPIHSRTCWSSMFHSSLLQTTVPTRERPRTRPFDSRIFSDSRITVRLTP